jgi:2-polyprenyl-3-methyl-5-hydroxy-6-metoxy-1,4-benzoquinol methylase
MADMADPRPATEARDVFTAAGDAAPDRRGVGSMETRRILCNACGADQFAADSTVDEWTIGHCRACGLVFVNPAPFFGATAEFSEMSRAFEYTEYMHQPVSPEILSFERQQLAANAVEMRRWSGGPAGSSQAIRFLDIGCGSGASIRAASDLGWDAIGIDIDPQLIQEGRDQLQVDLRCVPILESGLPSGSFDFVKLRDVIEHLPNPLEVLVKVRELLAPDGVVLLVTPNEGSLATQARVALRRRRTVVATVPPPHHLHSFSSKTLARTLHRAGLRQQTTLTTTPSDGRYVTSHNVVRAQASPILRPFWRAGRALGMGAVLVSWASKS